MLITNRYFSPLTSFALIFVVTLSGTHAKAETFCSRDPEAMVANIGDALVGDWQMTYEAGYLNMNGEYNELPDNSDPVTVNFAASEDGYVLTGETMDGEAKLSWRADDEIYDLPNDVEFVTDQISNLDMTVLAGCNDFLPVLVGTSDGGERAAELHLVFADENTGLGQVTSIQSEGAVLFRVSFNR